MHELKSFGNHSLGEPPLVHIQWGSTKRLAWMHACYTCIQASLFVKPHCMWTNGGSPKLQNFSMRAFKPASLSNPICWSNKFKKIKGRVKPFQNILNQFITASTRVGLYMSVGFLCQQLSCWPKRFQHRHPVPLDIEALTCSNYPIIH